MSNNDKFTYPDYQPRRLANGQPNPKYVDLTADVDPPLAGQEWAVWTFISPEKILKDKNLFKFEEFVKRWDFSKRMQAYLKFVNYISYKYGLSGDALHADFKDFLREESSSLNSGTTIEDDYKHFLDKHEEKLNKEFDAKHNFQTSVRAVKNSGNFATMDEAKERAKFIRELFPAYSVRVGPVGQFGVWDPCYNEGGDMEYQNDELNRLVHEKEKNAALSKHAFDTRVKEAKKAAIEENKKKAAETGNVLTQDIDESGELITTTTQETELQAMGASATEDDVHRVLFEGDNIVTDSNNDRGRSQLLSGPLAPVNENEEAV